MQNWKQVKEGADLPTEQRLWDGQNFRMKYLPLSGSWLIDLVFYSLLIHYAASALFAE